ncbi:glycosyltransferase family 4 protein [Candidatus Saccharibacteria bacterium]|nr:glycosyltransferase family 4 protein [Candidatus Saccharibacteria bacterium]
MIFHLKVSAHFTDKETGELLHPGDFLITKDETRAKDIIKRGLGKIEEIRSGKKKTGKQVLVYHEWLAPIGGVETAIKNLAQAFPKANLTFKFRNADLDNMIEIAQNHQVVLDNGLDSITTDVLIVETYNGYPQIKGRVKAKKIYQICHADWKTLKKVSQTFKNFEWKIDPDIDKVIAVSDTVQESLKTAFKKPIEAVVVNNIPSKPNKNFRTFLTLSRLTPEKGGKRIVEMIRRFHEAKQDFIWLIASNFDSEIREQLKNDPSVVFIEPNRNRTNLVRYVDYLVQLSDSESYCFSVHEALATGTPVIGTRIPEISKVVKDGYNGYLVNLDLSNLDVKKIFEKKPNPPVLDEPIDSNWEKILKGEL